MDISSDDMALLHRFVLQGEVPPGATLSVPLRRAIEFELPEPGLQQYFQILRPPEV